MPALRYALRGSSLTGHLMGERDFLFIGHRTTGKTTLARELARRGLSVVDLDEVIEASQQMTCAEIIASSEERFRELERTTLESLAGDDHREPRIIVVGAGCLSLPHQPVAVWLQRDGWVDSARTERARLRPNMSFEEEVEWMRSTREPVWTARADLLFDIPRGRRVERSVDMLETLLLWIDGAPGAIARKTWLVAPDSASLQRCQALVRRLGLAGIEMRSDLIGDPSPNLDVPVLASLRTADSSWLHEAWHRHRRMDLDLEFAEMHEQLEDLDDTSLIFSAHPAEDEWAPHLEALLGLAKSRDAQTKFAPTSSSAEGVRDILEQSAQVETVIVQGLQWAWMRPALAAHRNRLNYLALGLAGHRLGDESTPPFDLRDWLPHLSAGHTTRFDALVGQPAWPSQGDLWHRRAAISRGKPDWSYIKIDAADDDFAPTVELARLYGVRGFSVTSPFKPDAAMLVGSDTPLNTLVHRGGRWQGCDTDRVGMKAQLEWISVQFDVSKTCSLLGKGGVSAAVLRGIEDAGWTLVDHRGAREGWTGEEEQVDVLINGAGKWGYEVASHPPCKVWLDLHYANTQPPPVDAVHVVGDVFFDAQAAAQREFWDS